MCISDMDHFESVRTHWVATLATLYLGYQLGLVIYNLFFHPLAEVPGPFLGRSTLLWRIWDTTSGLHHKHMRDMHAKYGHVVRVSPSELSFSTVQSYRDIYGFPPPGGQHCTKNELYDIVGSGFKTTDIASERDPKAHARMKKHLTPAFSARALVSQEAIIHRCLDAFVAKIGPVSQRTAEGINMVSWFEMSSFDLFGEMGFGESFDCIADEKHHFWIDMVLHHVRKIVIIDNLRRLDIFRVFSHKLLPKLAMFVLAKHTQYTRDKVQHRLERESARQDFFTNLVSKVKAGEVEFEEMAAHASSLIIAGGETTATTSAAILYFLLKTPRALAKVTEEVRGRWASYEDIDSNSAQQLPYLQAVINEALRLYPAGGAHGFPRLSPGTTIDGLWVPSGTEVYTCGWVASRNPEYWDRPDEFIPERWTDPASSDVKAASQPFSLGFRACPGKSFAMLQLSLVFAKILYTYDLEMLNPEIDWEARSRHWIMWWKPPIRVRAHNRLGVSLISE
ncbi:cytochrome P450 [Xylaria curta]|nr:cytochrome P450 [Xylaria curta]